MHKLVRLLLLLVGVFGWAQRDTIQVSTSTAVVIFPTDISDRILGDDLNFFMSDPEANGSLFSKRILKLYYNERSTKEKDFTFLTVITRNGNSYEFVLEFKQNPLQKTWYIKPTQAITNILGSSIRSDYQEKGSPRNSPASNSPTPSLSDSRIVYENTQQNKQQVEAETALPSQELYMSDRIEYYRLRSYYMQFDKAKVPRFFARSGDVFLWLKGVYFIDDEIYVQLKIENQEGIDFDVKFLKYSIATSYKKSSSNQKTELLPVYQYKIPKQVKANNENHIVVVFKKFSLERNKVLTIDLDEENGNRNVSLEIDHHLINNPFRIK